MADTPRLNDLQLILLATAAQRADGHLLPPPPSIADDMARIVKTVPALLKRKIVAEVEASGLGKAWRSDEGLHFGLVITDQGRTIIAASEPLDPDAPTSSQDDVETDPPVIPINGSVPRKSKSHHVLDLLRREQGATTEELIAATGWLPHTTRAALTGLRKKGHAIERRKRDDATCYHLTPAA